VTTRFRPHRFGIVGLYEYADQEFRVEDGRLALRGRNTSGKSKALEVLVPFVLDGDITPRKLDPFASSAKTMRWNLIECTDAHPERRAAKRIGYVWAEFRAVDESSDGRYLTCGIGLEATRQTDGVKDRWYFTTAQRVGAGLMLTRVVAGGDAQPVVKPDLAQQLAVGGGALHDGPTGYKEALRAQLIPFVSPELYEQMLEVVRQLRKPKLSDSLNVTRLSTMLTQALPAVDDALVRKLGDALEQLHELQRQHDALRAARGQVASLVERELRAYARGVLTLRGDRLRGAGPAYERARAAVRSAGEEQTRLTDELAAGERRAQDALAEFRGVDNEYLQLVTSEAYKVVALLEDRSREHTAALERRERIDRLIEQADTQIARAREAAQRAGAAAAQTETALARAIEMLGELLAGAGLPQVAATDNQALVALAGRLELRRADLARVLVFAEAVHAAEASLRALAEPLAHAGDRRDAASAAAAEAEAQREGAAERLQAALQDWRARLTELAVDDATLEAMAERALAGEHAAGPLAPLVAARGDELAVKRARLAAAGEALDAKLASARERHAALEARRDPEPPARSPQRADRSQRAGAPLWAVCDFREDVSAGDRAALEAALDEAGVLDAWIAPDGRIADRDVSLVAGAPAHGPTLLDVLRADPGEHDLDAGAVEAVLRSIALDGVVAVAPGRFRFGALHGRASKAEPEYLGATARAALRRRLLAEARTTLDVLAKDRARCNAEDEQHAAAQARLATEHAAVPPTDEMRSALRAVARTADRLAGAEEQLGRLVADRDRHEASRAKACVVLADAARSADLPADAGALREVERTIDRAEPARERALAAFGEHARAATLLRTQNDEHAFVQAGRRDLDDEQRAVDADVAEAAGRLAAARAADGATAQELQARAAALRTRRDALERERTSTERALRGLTGAVKDAERAAAEADAALRTAEHERTAALEDVRSLGRHDVFSAALGDDAPDDERASATWTLTTALERVRALPAAESSIDLARRARRVSDAVSALQRSLVAFDMDASTLYADGITRVEVSRDGRRTTPTAMIDELDGEIAHREHVLSAKRREVLGQALLGEIAEHLRQKITEVRASVRARNETLRRCPTGAGRTVSVSWEADEEAAPAEVLDLLGDRAAANLDSRRQQMLHDFLERQIAAARSGAEDGAAAAARITDHLAVALDYRRWFRFALHLHERDGTRRRLTARTQGLGSGGEQSVLMHLPLFATAAALYDLAPGAPRIVALDEAMDGIDPQTREQVFEVLVELDLDWVMTSYDLNPCVATVPRAGLYELHRDNAEWGVWGQHFVWDGRDVTEVVDG
jgi:uncharacterized protein (TIGR02680 family)